MTVYDEVRSAWGASIPTDADDTIDNIVSVLVNEIEHRKSAVRVEYDDLKDTYNRGAYRAYGTKRETEDQMLNLRSQAMAYEQALSVLYLAMSVNKDAGREVTSNG